ncbi:MFS transporter [Sphingobium sp.]|uniref:spinster family MFS transporter n=1 Tax=Sphingobium sp. TaxID=1912891 RepID=UPI0028BDC9EA|nr:MFS transporter [Sphingobium sp.]
MEVSESMERPRSGMRIASPNKWRTLILLMLVGLTNYMDRLSISILQVPIKAELGLSDTQLGAVTGLSFSLVYTLAAIPIARLADRLSPKRVILVCLAAWNGLTMLCGLANGFLALAMLRMGVAIGEAGCSPAAQALLAHQFPARQRGRAIAIWQMVFPLGTLLGIFSSGMLSAALGWRTTFVMLGGLGLAVVPLIFFFLRDETRGDDSGRAQNLASSGDMLDALREILASRAYRLLLAAGFLGAIPLNAALNWNAPFYGRAFLLPIEQITIIVALISGVGGALGMFGGGFLSDFLSRKDIRWYCWMPAIAMFAVPLMAAYQYRIAETPMFSLPAGIIGAILLNCWIPPQAAIAQSLVQPSSRALAAACIVVTAGLGGAAGPFVTGVLSDALAGVANGQGDALAWSLAIMSLTSLPAALLFLLAGSRLKADMASFQSGGAGTD